MIRVRCASPRASESRLGLDFRFTPTPLCWFSTCAGSLGRIARMTPQPFVKRRARALAILETGQLCSVPLPSIPFTPRDPEFLSRLAYADLGPSSGGSSRERDRHALLSWPIGSSPYPSRAVLPVARFPFENARVLLFSRRLPTRSGNEFRI